MSPIPSPRMPLRGRQNTSQPDGAAEPSVHSICRQILLIILGAVT
jgi:hypothetical protein